LREVVNLFVLAKAGDIKAQRKLLNRLELESLPLRYQYLKSARKLGLSSNDLRELVIEAMFSLFRRDAPFDDQNLLNLFRYLYMRSIQQEMRSLRSKREVSFTDYAKDYAIKDFEFSFSSPNRVEEKEDFFSVEEFKEKVVKDPKVGLSKKESAIISYFLRGYRIKEIAKAHRLKQATVYAHYRNAVLKLKKFYREIYPDIFEEAEETS
jgi:RNA polymerase sigma factor (sigma-70 family)